MFVAIESNTFEAFADIQGMRTQPESEVSQWQGTDAQGPGSNIPEIQNGNDKIAVDDIGDGPNQAGDFLEN